MKYKSIIVRVKQVDGPDMLAHLRSYKNTPWQRIRFYANRLGTGCSVSIISIVDCNQLMYEKSRPAFRKLFGIDNCHDWIPVDIEKDIQKAIKLQSRLGTIDEVTPKNEPNKKFQEPTTNRPEIEAIRRDYGNLAAMLALTEQDLE